MQKFIKRIEIEEFFQNSHILNHHHIKKINKIISKKK